MQDSIHRIAKKHGVVIGRDDPILMVETLLEKIGEDARAEQKAALQHFAEEMESLTQRWLTDATIKAENALTAALARNQEMMVSALESAVASAMAKMQDETTTVLRSMSRAQSSLRNASTASVVAIAIVCLLLVADIIKRMGGF